MRAHTEAAFEALIEEHLLAHGYVSRPSSNYDPELALIAEDLLGYVQQTQGKKWERLGPRVYGDLRTAFLRAFDKATRDHGVLEVLRHGFTLSGITLRVATFRPAHGLNPDVERDYQANRVSVVRQVHHDPARPNDAVDMVLFLNGIPLVTVELKNALTSQRAGHAVHQYKADRDPLAPLFRFKQRALVHFALGADEAWMSTRLARGGTVFLPFNRGDGTAAGNPAVEGKHRTAYLWEDVLGRHSLLDIVARFVHLEKKEKERPDGTKVTTETMIFPRFHQLRVVRKLVAAATQKGAGTHYLVQHSAGSGKSNSIAWLAHRLASLHGGDDRRVYDGVVVLTDRRVLDQQLQQTIFQFDHKAGVVRLIKEGQSKSAQLASALQDSAPIIICTLHSFGAVADRIDALPERRYAVIVDEAHSSQGGDMAKAVRDIIGIPDEEDEPAGESEADRLARWSAERRRLPQNMSYFAFTATPKFKTLCLFGTEVGSDPETGRPIYEPFDLYSMRQAIEEGFILNVLEGYTTYERFFKLVKAISDDPELDKKKASRALARFVSLHPHNIAQKTEVMIEHFRSCVRPKLDGKAKAMVVTSSRLHAVRYKLAFDAYLAEKGYRDVRTLVAFSSEVEDDRNPGVKYTEPQLNRDPQTEKPLKESELPRTFAGDHHNVLIVANKYQTGFDEQRLVAMYVDKRLSGIQAVQTLSRLNRRHAGKTETFVLDFVNKREEIHESFQQFYESTTVLEAVDPQRLYELQGQLDAALVYYRQEVETFARAFFKPRDQQRPSDNAAMHAALDPAVDRFRALEDEDEQETFRGQLQAFCNLYGFLAQVVPFSDANLEKRYAFGKMLLRKLPAKDSGPRLDLGEDVALHYYRLTQVADGDILLTAEGTQPIYGPSETGTGAPTADVEKLSTLIDVINQRYATEFDNARDLVRDVLADLRADPEVQNAATANIDPANFDLVARPKLQQLFIDRMGDYGEFVNWLFEDVGRLAFPADEALPEMHRELRGEGPR